MSTPHTPHFDNSGGLVTRFSHVNPAKPDAIDYKQLEVAHDVQHIIEEYDPEDVTSPFVHAPVAHRTISGFGEEMVSSMDVLMPTVLHTTDFTHPDETGLVFGEEDARTFSVPRMAGLGKVSNEAGMIDDSTEITVGGGREKVREYLHYPEGHVATRVILLRHLTRKPFNERTKELAYDKLDKEYRANGFLENESDRNLLKELDESSQVKSFEENDLETRKLYESIFAGRSTDEVEIWFDDGEGKERNKMTVSEIERIFGNFEKVGDVSLPGSDKSIRFIKRNAKNLEEMVNVWDGLEEKTYTSIQKKQKEKLIVIIGNRAYAEHFLKLKEKRDASNVEAERRFKDAGYFCMDLGVKNGQIEPLQHASTTLVLSPEYTAEILAEIKILDSDLKVLLEEKNLSPERAQNRIFMYFQKLESQKKFRFFEKAIHSNCMPLRNFAIAHMLRNRQYDTVIRLLETLNHILSREEKLILVEGYAQSEEKSQYQIFFARFYVGKHYLWNMYEAQGNEKEQQDMRDENREIFDRYKLEEVFFRLQNHRDAYVRADKRQKSHTLDEKIKNDTSIDSSALVERKVYEIHSAWSDELGREVADATEIIEEHLLSVINSGVSYVNPGIMGQGKTIWLTKLAKQMALTDTSRSVYFYDAKENIEIEKDGIDAIGQLPEGSIVLIDSIDEMTDQRKQEKLKSIISKYIEPRSSKKLIFVVTARPSEYWMPVTLQQDPPTMNGKLETLGFRPIDKESYLQKQGLNVDEIRKVNAALEKSGLSLDVQGNPLMLYFIKCLATGFNPRWEKEYAIQSLDRIHNKADLYENIAKLLLIEHPMTKGQSISRTIADKYMEDLGRHAYKILSQENTIATDPAYFSSIGLLYREHNTDRSFKFIHNSFYEYFLARYFAKNPSGKEQMKEYIGSFGDSSGSKAKYDRFLPTIQFYTQILANEKRAEELFEFLAHSPGYVIVPVFANFSEETMEKLMREKGKIREYLEKLLKEPRVYKGLFDELRSIPFWGKVFPEESDQTK